MFDTTDTGLYGRTTTRIPAESHPPAHRSRPPGRSRWHWLLLVPVILPLLTPIYDRDRPTLAGMPFFYWFQLGLAALSTTVITVVHLKTKTQRRR